MLPRVFDLFAQADESLDRAQGGLGLGLTLVRQLVELHGGQVEARSEGMERGSEFVVRLPRRHESQRETPRPARVAASAPPSRSSDRSETSGQRILLVEDNQDSATMLAGLLESLGHRVQTTHDGYTALSAVDTFRPQVVLLDIGLPEMNGYEVARRIRKRRGGHAPLLVALTGYAHPQAIDQARRAGFDHHLVKPLDLDKLCGLLAEHANGGRARRPR
jgi:CheY-like chemotaxis protein